MAQEKVFATNRTVNERDAERPRSGQVCSRVCTVEISSPNLALIPFSCSVSSQRRASVASYCPQPASQPPGKSGLRPVTAPVSRDRDLVDRFMGGLKTVSEAPAQATSFKRCAICYR